MPTNEKDILPKRFVDLKAEVKTEMLKRDGYGSVVSYGGSEYDFLVSPEKDKKILQEHYLKLVLPLRAVNPENCPPGELSFDSLITENDLSQIEAKIAILSSITSVTTSNHGCAAMCTGLCSAGCKSGCTSCSGTCRGGCDSVCEDTCALDCAYGCRTGCKYVECKATCTANCADTCMSGNGGSQCGPNGACGTEAQMS